MLDRNILNINPEIVCNIILRSKEFQAKEGVTFSESIPESEYESDMMQILADHKDDLSYQEIKSLIEDLEPDQQIDLLTLMYVGREDYEMEEWTEARKEAKNNLTPNLTDYLLSKPFIAEYLTKALDGLGFSCDD